MTELAMYQTKQEKLVVLEMSFTIEYIICVINIFYYNVGQTFSLNVVYLPTFLYLSNIYSQVVCTKILGTKISGVT